MIEKLYLEIPIIASFLITLFLIPYWIRKSKMIGLQWKDMNKYKNVKVAGSGGIVVLLGFIIGALMYVAYIVFFLDHQDRLLIEIFALLITIILLSIFGFVDDLLGWQKKGLSKKSRLILVFIASIPLIAINAGRSEVALPLLGNMDLGLLYPLILVPLGIIGATTTYNFLAGLNGLETGLGILLLSSLGIVGLLVGEPWIIIISLCMIAPLIAFLIFNHYPSKIFPGDSLTYGIGGLIAGIAILGNFEKIAIFFFIPIILETLLKLRGGLEKYSFGKPKKDGSLDLKYDKVYSLNHLSILIMKKMRIKPTEKKVVYTIWAFQLIIIILGFLIFKQSIIR